MFGRKADSQPEPAEMPGFDDFEVRLGDLLRGERATLGKSLLDVQRDLRIRAAHIVAIENCDLSAFDPPSFAAGYVRSYARYLGLDPEETFRAFCAETGLQPAQGAGAPAAVGTQPALVDGADALATTRALYMPKPESAWSGVEPRAIGSLLVLLLLVGGLGFGGWSVLREVQKVSLGPVEDAPGIIAALDPAQEIGLAPQGEVVAIDLPRPDLSELTLRPQMLAVPELPARDSPIAAIDPNLNRPSRPLEGPVAMVPVVRTDTRLSMEYGPHLPADADAAFVPVVVQAAAEQVVVQRGVAILAARPAWVRITAADGTVLLEKTMDGGERYLVPDDLDAPAMLRAGNSGAIYFAVDGRTYGPSAPGAQVVKQILLTAHDLAERFPLADPTQDSDLAQMILVASVEPDPDTGSN